jgi:predicted metal-binding protein
VELYEVSLVDIPANEKAVVLSVKKEEEEGEKSLSPEEAEGIKLATLLDTVTTAESLTHELSIKEGRVLSGQNRQLVEGAVTALQGALEACQSLLSASELPKKIAQSILETLKEV